MFGSFDPPVPVPVGSRLRHEAGYHAVKYDAVVELHLHEFLDLRDMLGCEIGAQANDDVAVSQLEDHGVIGRSGGHGEGDD